MDLLKRNFFLIICGLATAGGIALGVTGMKAMPKVKAELEKAKSVYQNLDSLASKPVNRQRIEDEMQRIEAVKEDHLKIVERARSLYGWTLLVATCDGGDHDGESCASDATLCAGQCQDGAGDGDACTSDDDCGDGTCQGGGVCSEVLPYGTPSQRLEFKARYGDGLRAMFDSLTAGQPATDVDIRNMRDRIAAEKAAATEHESNPLIPAPVIYTRPAKNAADVLTQAGAQRDPVARAHLQAAQRIYCYATGFVPEQPVQGIYPSLEFDTVMANVDTLDPPFEDEVWNAQLSYWVQKDVVETIVALNEAAAAEATAKGGYGWVGNMPVKEVISVRVPRQFIPAQGDPVWSPAPGGYDAALPPGTPETVFTRDGSGDSYDVIQFTVKLVMDERDILKFVAKLCNNRFYVPLRIAYAAAPINKTMVGKIYGAEPAVIVSMDFEIPLLGEVFRRWMPQEIRDQNNVVCRPQDNCQSAPE